MAVMADGSKSIARGAAEDADAVPSGSPHAPGRVGKREESRRRVERVALSMFARHGFDAVTVEDVCAEARIAPATFYRYFGSKEGVIFGYEEGFLVAAAEIGASVDPRLPTVEQVSGVVRSCARFFEQQSDMLALRDDIVLVNEALLQRTFAVQRRFESRLAEALAGRRQEAEPSIGTLLDAAVCLAVLRLGVRAWRRGRDSSLHDHALVTYESLRSRLR